MTIPHVQKGQPITAAGQNRIIDGVNRTANMWGAGHTAINGPGGIQIGMPLPVASPLNGPEVNETQKLPRPLIVVVQIIGIATGGGKYNGTIIWGNSCAIASENLAMPEAMISTGNNNALILNLAENGLGDVHTLIWSATNSQGAAQAQTYVLGRIVGYTTETVPRAIVIVSVAPGGGTTCLP